MRAFPGHLTAGTCPATPTKPSSWHDYGLDASVVKTGNKPNTTTPYSYWLSPGYQRTTEPGARLARDFLRWTRDVQAMVDSKADWQLVPFNAVAGRRGDRERRRVEQPLGSRLLPRHAALRRRADEQDHRGRRRHRVRVGAGPATRPGHVERCHQMQTSDIFVAALPGGGYGPQRGADEGAGARRQPVRLRPADRVPDPVRVSWGRVLT